MLVGIPVFLPMGSAAQLIVGLIICFISMMLYTTFSPYTAVSDDQLAKVWDRRILRESRPNPVGVFAGHAGGMYNDLVDAVFTFDFAAAADAGAAAAAMRGDDWADLRRSALPAREVTVRRQKS